MDSWGTTACYIGTIVLQIMENIVSVRGFWLVWKSKLSYAGLRYMTIYISDGGKFFARNYS